GREIGRKTKTELQEITEINDNPFLVVGNTKASGGLRKANSKGVRLMNKVWLAQITGKKMPDYATFLRLDIREDIQEYLTEIKDKKLFVWLVRDPYKDNTDISDFEGDNISYHKADNIQAGNSGQVYANFVNEFFDQDRNGYDQFTFALGPDMIIQVRYAKWQCVGKCFEMEIVITGGTPHYKVIVRDDGGQNYEVHFDLQEGEEFICETEKICAGSKYTAIVIDHDGLGDPIEEPFEVEEHHNTLDLGEDQDFDETQQAFPLDAGAGLDDPGTASYQWTFNGQPVDYNGQIFMAEEPGVYCVKITTGDLSCQLEDCITLGALIDAKIEIFSACNEKDNAITITITDGTSPY